MNEVPGLNEAAKKNAMELLGKAPAMDPLDMLWMELALENMFIRGASFGHQYACDNIGRALILVRPIEGKPS